VRMKCSFCVAGRSVASYPRLRAVDIIITPPTSHYSMAGSSSLLPCFQVLLSPMTRAGFPAATAHAGTSLVTTAPIPTTALAVPGNLWHGEQRRSEGDAAIGRADDGDVCGQQAALAVRRARRRRR